MSVEEKIAGMTATVKGIYSPCALRQTKWKKYVNNLQTNVTLYEIRRLASRCPSRKSLLLVQFSIALKEEIIAL